MVYRDPDTGKFVSDGSSSHGDVDRYARVTGALSMSIPAADLSGGINAEELIGDEAEIVDFSNNLDNDEVFVVHRIDIRSVFTMPTTATAEGSGFAAYRLVADQAERSVTGALQPVDPYGRPEHFSGGEDGLFNVRQAESFDSSDLYQGMMVAENSWSDTANSVAGGAAPGDDRTVLEFEEENRPAFDSNDELTMPSVIDVQNVSDHAIALSHSVVLHGAVIEV